MAELLRTKPDATNYSGMSVRSLHRYAELGLLTKYKVGGRLRWHTKKDCEISASVWDEYVN